MQSNYYNNHDNSHHNRLCLCGTYGDKHYPGESVRHDMLCLCTPVPEGPTEGTNDELCGRKTGGLGAAETEGPRMGFGPNAESVKKTWEDIVQSCLRYGVRKGLKNLMEEFNKEVELKKNRLGGEMEDNPTLCGGNALNNTCVNYAGDRPGAESVCARSQTWWQRLYEAIKDEPPEEEIENKQKAEKLEKVETNKPSENNPEIPKVKTLTATTQTTSPGSGTLINRNQWPLLIFLFN
ncbi:unnamed protein product [Trypanosoma congolense IL3000]|uniref:WGS project CAEQ00000000 data, annotated contig 1722 n=1 Tax=Trypanosoma congolense (strain IL3000) TaxID=1068625 RepID=F9W8A9_TRYCI|nr:unnamed protein product [Trypanosoma congolense IL3000]